MYVTPEHIEDYFARYAWSYTRSSEDTWITGVRTSVSSFRIFVRLSEHWVYFVINPFVVAPPKPIDRVRFYYHVLRLNLDMNMAKFGLDNDGDLFLAVELPTENFNYSHFADALNGISHHAERLYSEVFNLAHNADMVRGRYDDEMEEDDIPKPAQGERERSSESGSLPMDDFDLPEDLINDSSERTIIGGKEVRIVDDENGFRIEFETAHDGNSQSGDDNDDNDDDDIDDDDSDDDDVSTDDNEDDNDDDDDVSADDDDDDD